MNCDCATCDGSECLSCEVQISQDQTFRLRWSAIKREIDRAPDPVARQWLQKAVAVIEEEIR